MRVNSPYSFLSVSWLKFVLLALVVSSFTFFDSEHLPAKEVQHSYYYDDPLEDEMLEPASTFAGSRLFRHIQATITHNRTTSGNGKNIKFQLDNFILCENQFFHAYRIFDDFVLTGHRYEPEWFPKAQHINLFRQTLF